MTALSLGVYVVGYAFVFGWGIWYLVKILRHGPQPYAEGPSLDHGSHTPHAAVGGRRTAGGALTWT